jgi:hypothetical protein
MDDAVWDVTVFTKNRERLIAGTISQKKRKLIEKVFGWAKLDSVLRQVKVRGLKRVDWFYRLTMAAYNLMRMRRLIPIQPAA